MLSFAALAVLELRRAHTQRKHNIALATSVVEFHKHQCYFVSAVQIAAIIFNRAKLTAAPHVQTHIYAIYDFILS